MASVAIQLHSGNVTKLIQSMDKQGKFVIDHNDEAVRSMLVVENGKSLEPYVPPSPPKPVVVHKNPQKMALDKALLYTSASTAAIGLGSKISEPEMLATFALSVWIGNQAVRGVSHALHSPLMSITNTISGMTAVGGMLQLGDELLPYATPRALVTTAVMLSAIDLVGGFLITHKMLEMFRKKNTPPEYWHHLLIPPAVTADSVGMLSLAGVVPSNLTSTLSLASGFGYVAGIAQMSTQETARLAVYAGMDGVGMGLASILIEMAPDHHLSIAGASTAIGDFMIHLDAIAIMPAFHAVSTYLGAWMGGITATGSLIAFGKLSEKLNNKPLQLPMRDTINISFHYVLFCSYHHSIILQSLHSSLHANIVHNH